jgi:hypothetical protein
MTFLEACNAILRDPKASPYAQTYARAGINLYAAENREAVRIQALYILSNLSHWRSPQAKEVRAVLRKFAA